MSVVNTTSWLFMKPTHHRVSPAEGAGVLCPCIGHSALGPRLHVHAIPSLPVDLSAVIAQSATGAAARPATWQAKTAHTSAMSRRRIECTLVSCPSRD